MLPFCLFICRRPVSYVPNVDNVSRFSIPDCLLGVLTFIYHCKSKSLYHLIIKHVLYMREVEHIDYQLFLLGNTVHVNDIPTCQVLVGCVLLYCVVFCGLLLVI